MQLESLAGRSPLRPSHTGRRQQVRRNKCTRTHKLGSGMCGVSVRGRVSVRACVRAGGRACAYVCIQTSSIDTHTPTQKKQKNATSNLTVCCVANTGSREYSGHFQLPLFSAHIFLPCSHGCLSLRPRNGDSIGSRKSA
jgi:hypothetical protein